MKAAGYATALFGKWHLGQQGKYHPAQRGFDEAITSMGKHFDFATQPKVEYPKGAYLADWLTDQALEFIETEQGRAVLPLPAPLRRPRAAPGEAGTDRAVQGQAAASAGTTTRPTPR